MSQKLINAAVLARLYIGFKAAFMRGLRSREDSAEWARIATLIPSSTASEEYAWLGQFPQMREWIGERVIKQLKAHNYTIRNRDFEATVEVARNHVEDDTVGIYGPLFEEMGISAAEWPNGIIYDLLKAGETENGYDGVPFFSASHPEAGGTAANLQSGVAAPWFLLDTTRALKPLIFQRRKPPMMDRLDKRDDPNVFMSKTFLYGVDSRGAAGFGLWQMAFKSSDVLSETNFDDAMESMMSRVNDDGKTLGIRPNLMIVGPEQRAAAKALLERQLISAGESNKNFQAVDLLVTPNLLGAT